MTLHTLLLLASLLLDVFSSLANTLQYALPILVHLQLVYDDFTGVNADWNALAVRLFSRNAFDVDEVLQAVHGYDLPFTPLV